MEQNELIKQFEDIVGTKKVL